ncbi:MAG TPA: hypothetical protein VKU85_00845 [bacterium]|nr:hypothetical protein [bacterium]
MTKHVDDPSASPTAVVVVVFTLLVVITILALQAYFTRVNTQQLETKVISRTPEEKAEVFAEQHRELSEYRWVDREQGVVGIPVEQAMKIVVAENAQAGGTN